jgi:hypothetical protein
MNSDEFYSVFNIILPLNYKNNKKKFRSKKNTLYY